MTVLHLQGTKLAEQSMSKPLVKPFIVSLGFLFVLTMHYFQHNPGGSGLELSFNTASWIPFSLAISLGLLEICRQKVWRYSRVTIVLFACCLLLTLPVFYPNADASAVANRLIVLWAGFLFFIGLQQFTFTPKQRQRMLWLILIGVLIQAAFGWYQFMWMEADNTFGYNTLNNRPYGIFQQPNVMASFLATGLVLSAYLLARIPMYRGKWSWLQLLLLLTPVITIPIIVALSSRTGWIGAIVGVGLMIPYLRRFAAKAQLRMWLLMIVMGLSVSWSINSTTGWGAKTERITLESARSTIIPQAYKMFRTEPLMGYGYGKFEPAYITQTAKWHQADPNQPYGMPSLDHPHNELVYWAAEGGIIPLIALLLAAAAVLFKISKAREGTQLALAGLFFPIVLHTQLEYPFYHSLAHWVIFIILIYWVDNLTAKYNKHEMQYVMTIKSLALIMPIVVSSFMLTALYSGWLLTKFETTRPVNIDYLMQVNNPWAWQNRFDWDLHLTQLQLGTASNNPALIEEYIQWATKKAVNWPRPALYHNLISAYQLLGKPERASQIKQEAEYLFPGSGFATSETQTALPSGTVSQTNMLNEVN